MTLANTSVGKLNFTMHHRQGLLFQMTPLAENQLDAHHLREHKREAPLPHITPHLQPSHHRQEWLIRSRGAEPSAHVTRCRRGSTTVDCGMAKLDLMRPKILKAGSYHCRPFYCLIASPQEAGIHLH